MSVAFAASRNSSVLRWLRLNLLLAVVALLSPQLRAQAPQSDSDERANQNTPPTAKRDSALRSNIEEGLRIEAIRDTRDSWLGGMVSVAPPNLRDAREEQTALLEGDDAVVQEIRKGGDLAAARQELEQCVGETPGNATAWFNLGCLTAATREWNQALECFAQARQIDPDSPLADKAQLQLRRIGSYLVHGVRRDDAQAMYGLGMMYEFGWGPNLDRQTAKKWYRSAAILDNSDALYRLGTMYEQDLATVASHPPAETWYRQQRDEMYRKAADLGNEQAKQRLDNLDRPNPVFLQRERADATAPDQVLAGSLEPSVDARRARDDYRYFVRDYGSMAGKGLKLLVTAVEGDTNGGTKPPPLTGITRYGSKIAIDGALSHFSHSDFGSKGGSGSKLAPADLLRLDELLPKLPDDGGRLPPPGRRVLIGAAVDGQTIVRVYDRANAPAEVLEILRLSRSQIRAWVPKFHSQSEVDTGHAAAEGFLSLSPDGKQILFADKSGRLEFWGPINQEPLGVIRRNSTAFEGITFSPNGSLAVIKESRKCTLMDTKQWKSLREFVSPSSERKVHQWTRPRFTPDGKHLVLECSEPSLRIVDTTTWEPVAHLPSVPEDAVQFVPAFKKQRAVIRTKNGTVALWDLERHALVANLDQGCSVNHLVYSPDETLFATVTHVPRSEERIRLWETDSGRFVRDLRPFEQVTCERVSEPLWSPDGEYLFAAAAAHSFYSAHHLCVWNVRTGRHRGELSLKSSNRLVGLALLPDGSQLAAGGNDGFLRFWNFPAVMRQIRALEDSLERAK